MGVYHNYTTTNNFLQATPPYLEPGSLHFMCSDHMRQVVLLQEMVQGIRASSGMGKRGGGGGGDNQS